jgi:hypothetical protein
MINHTYIIGIIILVILYKIISKNKDQSYKTNIDTIYVILRIKDDNLENTENFLRSFQKQDYKNKKLIIMNDNPNFEKYFIIYCDLNNNTDLYSAEKLDESKFNLILNDLQLDHNQIVITTDNDDYFMSENVLTLISEKKIKSFRESNLKQDQPKYYHYQKIDL